MRIFGQLLHLTRTATVLNRATTPKLLEVTIMQQACWLLKMQRKVVRSANCNPLEIQVRASRSPSGLLDQWNTCDEFSWAVTAAAILQAHSVYWAIKDNSRGLQIQALAVITLSFSWKPGIGASHCYQGIFNLPSAPVCFQVLKATEALIENGSALH